MRRIAVFNTAFLGDAVLTLPLLQTLRLRYPGTVIDFYVREGLRDLFAPHPALDAVFACDKRGKDKGFSGLVRLGRDIAARRYDLWISAHASVRSGLLALMSGAPLRIGYATPFLNRALYTRCVDRHFGDLDEIERLLELLRPLGAGTVLSWPEIVLDEGSREAARGIFADLRGPVLGLHPGSLWATKRWPISSFAEIGCRALDRGADVLLFAGPGEEDIARKVRDEIGRRSAGRNLFRLRSLAGKLSLPLLAACLARLSCYLTNDSGPMHLAWAQHVPVTALFGPTVRALGFFPRGVSSSVLEAAVPCRPCGLHGPAACPLRHHQCMLQIAVDDVWRDVESKLMRGKENAVGNK